MSTLDAPKTSRGSQSAGMWSEMGEHPFGSAALVKRWICLSYQSWHHSAPRVLSALWIRAWHSKLGLWIYNNTATFPKEALAPRLCGFSPPLPHLLLTMGLSACAFLMKPASQSSSALTESLTCQADLCNLMAFKLLKCWKIIHCSSWQVNWKSPCSPVSVRSCWKPLGWGMDVGQWQEECGSPAQNQSCRFEHYNSPFLRQHGVLPVPLYSLEKTPVPQRR